jgi:hypothetical protein
LIGRALKGERIANNSQRSGFDVSVTGKGTTLFFFAARRPSGHQGRAG